MAMGRPRLEIGTFGDINTQLLTNGHWKARARFRDRDGVTREVKAVATTEAKAKAKLRGTLKDRRRGPAGTDDELTPESTVADLLTHWIATCRADTALARTNPNPQLAGRDTGRRRRSPTAERQGNWAD
ncbi:hypothetical protein ACT18_21790, partial [Mycolicibacter kumamotonensis]